MACGGAQPRCSRAHFAGRAVWGWFAYTASALAHTSGAPRIVIAYEDTVADPLRQLERIARFLGREPAAVADRAMAFVDPGLRHHRASTLDLAVPRDVRALHAVLTAAATEEPGALDTVLDRLAEATRDARAPARGLT